jgi:threonine synthase
MNDSKPAIRGSIGVIERYWKHLPVTSETPVISLNEGSTPLIPSRRLSALVDRGRKVYLKYEGMNPTGSFKDRGMTMAVSKAVERGAKLVICASTGNTSAAAAAYAARAGIRCAVLLPAGRIALGKLAQAFAYGAVVIGLEGHFDQCLQLVREFSSEPGVVVVNSINPDRLEGQKTASFEVVDELGDAPHLHILPIGNAGNITAYWKGYREYWHMGLATRLPMMLGLQAGGAAPIYYDRVIPNPETAASAIRIGNPAGWKTAKVALEESRGVVDIVSDEEIFAAQRWLASREGVFAEPASAASVAGLLKCCADSSYARGLLTRVPDDGVIVCTLTGHGLKDIACVLNDLQQPIRVAPTKAAILSVLENTQ